MYTNVCSGTSKLFSWLETLSWMKCEAAISTKRSSLPCMTNRGRLIFATFSRNKLADVNIAAAQRAFMAPCQTSGSFTYLSTCKHNQHEERTPHVNEWPILHYQRICFKINLHWKKRWSLTFILLYFHCPCIHTFNEPDSTYLPLQVCCWCYLDQ